MSLQLGQCCFKGLHISSHLIHIKSQMMYIGFNLQWFYILHGAQFICLVCACQLKRKGGSCLKSEKITSRFCSEMTLFMERMPNQSNVKDSTFTSWGNSTERLVAVWEMEESSFWLLKTSGSLDVCWISFEYYFWIVPLACPPPFFKCNSESLELPFNPSLMSGGWQKVNFSDPWKDFIETSRCPREVKTLLKRKTAKTFCTCNLAFCSISRWRFSVETFWSVQKQTCVITYHTFNNCPKPMSKLSLIMSRSENKGGAVSPTIKHQSFFCFFSNYAWVG